MCLPSFLFYSLSEINRSLFLVCKVCPLCRGDVREGVDGATQFPLLIMVPKQCVQPLWASKDLGLDVTKGTVVVEGFVKQTKFFVSRLKSQVKTCLDSYILASKGFSKLTNYTS